MIRAGDSIQRANGEQLTFLKTAADTNGALLEVEVMYAPKSSPPPLHYHPHQDEVFFVERGAMRTLIGREERTYRAGETFMVPRGTPHKMHNASDEAARVVWQVRPALRTEDFFKATWTLPEEEQDLLKMAVIAQSFSREFRLSKPPYVLQQLLFAALAPLGRLRGYRLP